MTCRGWRFEEWGDDPLADEAVSVAADVEASVAWAPQLAPLAGHLCTDSWRYMAALATLGAVDLTAARVIEPHLDALAILAQAGSPDLSALGVTPETVWGVYAAGGPGHRLEAEPAHAGGGADGEYLLTGSKPWCSLGDRLRYALITAVERDEQRLFAVELAPGRVEVARSDWHPLGLADVTTVPLRLERARAMAVGEPGWYLQRSGFAWGGIGVAAVWFGGAAAVAGRLLDAAQRREPDQIALAAMGRVDRALHGALLALMDAARAIDGGGATGAAGAKLAARVRAMVAATVDEVLRTVGHALGPAPLAQDAEHARRVADLTLYVRQHHAERDLAVLGRQVLESVA